MSNVEAWINTQTEDTPRSARDIVYERLRNDASHLNAVEKTRQINEAIREAWQRVPVRTELYASQGVDYEAAKARAEAEAQATEERLRKQLPKTKD